MGEYIEDNKFYVWNKIGKEMIWGGGENLK